LFALKPEYFMPAVHNAHFDDHSAQEAAEQKRAALRLMMDAFAEGELEGIDPDCMVQAALFTAFKEFVMTYGEEPVAKFAERLPERVRNGEFTVQHHA
jgi:hypothetical protein